MEEEVKVVQLGDYRLQYENGSIRVTNTNHRKSLAVVPSSGNCVVIVPVERGLNQFKTT